jgi:hypothetical protein
MILKETMVHTRSVEPNVYVYDRHSREDLFLGFDEQSQQETFSVVAVVER